MIVEHHDTQSVRLTRGSDAVFTFDHVFPMDTSQAHVFDHSIKGTVNDVLQGYNGTIFAYGQTGSGKTYTMMGADIQDDHTRGIIPRLTDQVFQGILHSPPTIEYTVKVSFMEIYMEKIRDLLAPDRINLPIQEDKSKGVRVKGLSEHYMSSPDEVYDVIRRGTGVRVVSATRMNAESSRSHTIFTFTVQQRNTETGATKSGCLYLVDLAGSEKVDKTGASGQTLEEAKKINRSLSALGMVINALTDGKSAHVPYRDSKLTRILQESLGGNSRTTLIVNCSPVAYNADETLSTLRFGVRAKSIKNNARINAELSPNELRELVRKAHTQIHTYQSHIKQLETEVEAWRRGESVPMDAWTSFLGEQAPSSKDVSASAAVAQEQRLIDQNRTLEAELMQARWKLEEVQMENRELKELADMAPSHEAPAEVRVVETPAPRTSREQRVEEMLQALEGRQVALEPVMACMKPLVLACRQAPDFPLRMDQLEWLEEEFLRTHMALSEQVMSTRIATQEMSVLQQQKQALESRNAALQQRFDLITNQIGALENGLRVGEEGAVQLAELRHMLEEHSSTHLENTSSETLHLEQLLAIRGEETAGLQRSLEDLKASHEEQRRAMTLLSAAVVRGDERGPDPACVQRLVDASRQMEKARELVTLRLREYERLKERLMDGLRERSERVVDLEMALEEMQDQFRVLLQNMDFGAQQRKMAVIERRLEQLMGVQQRLIEQNTTLKRDVALAEKRLASRADTIEELEWRLDAQNVDEEWDSSTEAHARIAKPLRGGGAESTSAATPQTARRWFFHA